MLISDNLVNLLINKNRIFVNEIKNVSLQGIDSMEALVREIPCPVIMLNADLNQFGYRLTLRAMLSLTVQDAIEYYERILRNKETQITAAGKNFEPFYRDFPDGVMLRSDEELFVHQIVHYISEGEYKPSVIPTDEVSNIRVLRAVERQNYIDIDAIDVNGIYELTRNLCMSESALMPTDRMLLAEIGQTMTLSNVFSGHNVKIPFKENLCFLMREWNIMGETVTDYLRYFMYLNHCDITLTDKYPRFAKMPRSDRREFMRHLNRFLSSKYLARNAIPQYIKDDMKRHREMWLNIGRHIHAGEYKEFSHAWTFFDILRNERIVTTMGDFQKKYNAGDMKEATSVLLTRPGEFARRLNMLIQKFGDDALFEFEKIASECSYNVLYGLLNYFLQRNELLTKGRSVILKTDSTPYEICPLEKISDNTIFKAVAIITDAIRSKTKALNTKNSIIDTFAEYDTKYICLDKRLYNIPLGKSMRTLSENAKIQCPRGTKFDISDNKYIRFYVHWIDPNGTEDLDLSAQLYSADFTKHLNVSWCGSQKDSFCVFSGDVRHRKGACAEYIDLDIEEAILHNYRYAVINVNNYEGRAFDTLDCWCGWEERSSLENTGAKRQFWAPDSVKNGFKLANSTTSQEIMCIVDLHECCVYAVDEGSGMLRVACEKTYKNVIERFTCDHVNIFDLLFVNLTAAGFKPITSEAREKMLETLENVPYGERDDNWTERWNEYNRSPTITFETVVNDYSSIYPLIYPQNS